MYKFSLFILHFMFGILLHLNYYLLHKIFFLAGITIINRTAFLGTISGAIYSALYASLFIYDISLPNKIHFSGHVQEFEQYYIVSHLNQKIKIYKSKNNLFNMDYITAKIFITKNDNLYNKINNIHYTGQIIKIYASKEKSLNPFQRYYNYLDYQLRKFAYSDDHYAILVDIILGNGSYISSEMRTLFNNHGASHILCISGLHISSILLCSFLFFRKIFAMIGRRYSYFGYNNFHITILFAILLTLFYMIVAGGKVSSLRAFSISLLFTISILTTKKRHIIQNLFFIAFLLLLIFPYYIIYPSFQLSFLCVYIIFLFSNSFYLPLYLFASTFLIVIYHFEICSISSIIVNLAIIPLTSFVFMPLIIIFLIFPQIEIFLHLLNITVSLILQLLRWFPQYIITFSINLYVVCVFTYLLILITFYRNLKVNNKKIISINL